jgi:hypothetical protein
MSSDALEQHDNGANQLYCGSEIPKYHFKASVTIAPLVTRNPFALISAIFSLSFASSLRFWLSFFARPPERFLRVLHLHAPGNGFLPFV